MTSEYKSFDTPGIVLEEELAQGNGKNGIDKSRNRAIAEGYRYQTLEEDLSVEDEKLNALNRRRNPSRWSNNYPFICALAVMAIIIGCLVGAITYQYFKIKSLPCNDPTCVQVSAYITNKMDLTADPCQDFYQYACGNWESTVHIPDTRAKYGIFNEIADKITTALKKIVQSEGDTFKGKKSSSVQKLKEYYKTCMDMDTIESQGIGPVNELIIDLGLWTITNASGKVWHENTWDFSKALISNHVKSFAALFGMGISNDNRNHTVNIIHFGQAGLSLGSYEMYNETNSKYEKLRAAFMKFGTKLGELLGGETTHVKERIEKLYLFEQELAKIFTPKEELDDPVKNYHKMTVKELQTLTGDFLNMTDYLQKRVSDKIQETEEILVPTPNYFKQLGPLVKKTEKSVLADYIVFNIVNGIVGYLPQRFIDAAIVLSKVETGVDVLDPRWMRCLNKAGGAFGYVTGALYLQDNFAETSKAEVAKILEMVRKAFINNLQNVPWMDQTTRDRAKEKALFINTKIAYPEWVLNPDKLDEHYENVTVKAGQFLKNMLAVSEDGEKQMLNKYGLPPDPNDWSMTPTEVNAYYSAMYNEIVFPAGILQKPFYSPKFPMSYNFGTTGMIIGHELTHGFDNTGRKFDKVGNMHNWWTDSSAKNFKANTKCMVDQYSSYQINGTHLKGDRTLGENIADNGGVKMAYQAFKKWSESHEGKVKNYAGLNVNEDQLFFIGFAQLWCSYYKPEYIKRAILLDVHPIAKYRVRGALSNNREFAEAYQCHKGSPMNPVKKCSVW